jgi:hypothetical protein
MIQSNSSISFPHWNEYYSDLVFFIHWTLENCMKILFKIIGIVVSTKK